MTPRHPELYVRGEPSFGSIWGGEEREAALTAMANMAANGPYQRTAQLQLEDMAAARLGGGIVLTTNSGGTALDCVLDALDIGADDEVISCPVNFFGVHLAVLRRGAHLTFADCEPGSLNLGPDAVARMTQRTRAVVITHMNGLAAETELLRKGLASRADALGISAPFIIEDAARAMGADLPTPTGPGWARIFSLHRKKVLSTLGEGGLVQTHDPGVADHVRRLRSYGLGKGLGASLRLSEVQAAVGVAQMRRLDHVVAARRKLIARREAAWTELCVQVHLSTLRTSGDVPYLHTILLSPALAASRDAWMAELAANGIGTVVANRPTYDTHELVRRATDPCDLHNSDDVGRRLVCLPVHPRMTDDDEEWLAQTVAVVTRTLVGS